VAAETESADVAPRNKMVLRANVPGALLSIGDVAAIGDEGLCNSHIVTASEVTVTVNVLRKVQST
jgi:acetamidase/formamidase